MNSGALILIGEALVVYLLVLLTHALRHRVGLAPFYALLGGITAVMSWVTDAGVQVEVGGITFLVGSTVFYTALLLGVFVIYVFDGPVPARTAILTVAGVSALVPVIAVVLHMQMNLTGHGNPASVPVPSLRINAASVLTTVADLVFLAMFWELLGKKKPLIGLWSKAFVALLGVMWLDVLLFSTGAFFGRPEYLSIMKGTFFSRLAIATFAWPFICAYLAWQTRLPGAVIQNRPVLAILREVAQVHGELRLAKQEIGRIREVERALRESEQRFRVLFESSLDAIMTLEPPLWQFTSGNPATVNMFKAVSEQDFTAHEPWTLSPERQPDGRASADKAKEMIETAMRDGSHFFEWTHQRINGESFPATVLLSRMETAGKVFFQATVRDITEQKQAENSLRRSKEFSELILNSMHDAISIIDVRDFSIVGVNKTFLDQLGLTEGEVIGKTCYGVTHHRDHPCTPPEDPCPIAEILKTGQPATFEHKHVGKDGEPSYVEITGSPIRNDSGEIIQIVHVAKDITERKRAEEERQFRNILLSTQQEVAIDGILVVDETARIISYNRRFVEMWRLPPKLVENKVDEPVLQFVTSQVADPQSFLQRVRYLYEHRHEMSLEEVVLTDGRVFDRYSAPMFGPNERYYGRVWYFRDITTQKQAEGERRELEKQLFEKQKLAAVGTLASGMGHEINNPIMGIINYAQLIKDRLQGKNEALEEYVGEIVIEAERIAGIVRGLSAFATRDIATRAAVPVSDLIESALAPLRDALTQDHIALEIDLPDNLPAVVCDRQQLVQVLTSLLSNASDALNERYPGRDENKKVLISARAVGDRLSVISDQLPVVSNQSPVTSDQLSGETRSGDEEPLDGDSPLITDHRSLVTDFLRLTVEDHGTGIPLDIRGHIFEPFFTTKDKSVGAGNIGKGLGLFVSYAIVQEHGGVLSVESEVGQWTRFHVDLPISDKGYPISHIRNRGF